MNGSGLLGQFLNQVVHRNYLPGTRNVHGFAVLETTSVTTLRTT
jgi:hypothetical protein